MRRCTKCGRTLPETEFYKRTKDGSYISWCRDCKKKYTYDRKHNNLPDATGKARETDALLEYWPIPLGGKKKK